MAMDYFKFIEVIRRFPEVWDRNCSGFKDKQQKTATWERIGEIMSHPGMVCKHAFKSLREKYVREREKQSMCKAKYVHWQHLDSLAFLDPHIMLRKQSINVNIEGASATPEPVAPSAETQTKIETQTPSSACTSSGSVPSISKDGIPFTELSDMKNDFDKALIELVRKSGPIWNRKSNGYPSKQLKFQLWKTIAQSLDKDINLCMSRWKGLREKYIRQKCKYQDGDPKWEFLDDMDFLDGVIQYRRKNSDNVDSTYQPKNYHGISSTTSPAMDFYNTRHNSHVSYEEDYYNDFSNSNDNSINESLSNDFVVKSENNTASMDSVPATPNYHHDNNNYDSIGVVNNGSSRKRTHGEENAVCPTSEKLTRDRSTTPQKDHATPVVAVAAPLSRTPEEVFGDLVAAMLAKKTERDKNVAMIEIMQILTK